MSNPFAAGPAVQTQVQPQTQQAFQAPTTQQAQPQFAPPAQDPNAFAQQAPQAFQQAPAQDPNAFGQQAPQAFQGQPAAQPQVQQAPPAAQPTFAPQPQHDTFGAPASTQPAAAAPSAGGDPFAAPIGNTEARIANYVGELILFKPREYQAEYKTSQGIGPMVAGDMAVLTNTTGQFVPGTIEQNMFIFQKLLVRDLRATMDGAQPMLLARLVKGEARNGNSAPYIFQEATEDDKALARQFLSVVQF